MLQMPAKYKINNQRTQWKHIIPLQPIGRRACNYINMPQCTLVSTKIFYFEQTLPH